MKCKATIGCVAAMLVADGTSASESEWYGSLKAGYLFGDGEAILIGTTSSVYGGFPSIAMDNGGEISIATGRLMPNGWRLEAELGFLNLDTDSGVVSGLDDRADDSFRLDGSVDSTVLMFNTLIDLNVNSERFTPYLKAGIGLARNEAQASLDVEYASAIWNGTSLEGQSASGIPYSDAFETSFAWNIGAGVRTALTDRFLMTLEFGFVDLGDAVTAIDENNDAVEFSDLSSQRLLLGLNYRF
jgi:opacity protein-like surface antigen